MSHWLHRELLPPKLKAALLLILQLAFALLGCLIVAEALTSRDALTMWGGLLMGGGLICVMLPVAVLIALTIAGRQYRGPFWPFALVIYPGVAALMAGVAIALILRSR